MPDLYLCLELAPKTAEDVYSLPDDVVYKGLKSIMLHEAVNGEKWVRGWRAFATRDEAIEHAKDELTIVVIPFDCDTVDLEAMP